MKFSILIIILLLSGCASHENIRDKRFTTGCAVVDSSLQAGIANNQGIIEACKLVCSDKLPDGFHYKYESRGCTIEVGGNGK